MFSFIFVEMEFEPCNFFNAPYLLEIFHVMIFSSTCEMKLVAYHNIVMSKICEWCLQFEYKRVYNHIAINMQLICH